MKYYISGFEDPNLIDTVLKTIPRLNYILFTFYKLQNDERMYNDYRKIQDNCKNILIDSGAFTLQRNAHSDYDQYVKDYCRFIEQNDNPKITGYFEMDIDNIIGYDRVLEYRDQLEEVSNKIIPVWHSNRGIKDFKKLCRDYKYISVTLKSSDIKRDQVKMFVDYAHRHNTRIHGLGVSAKSICDHVPFDSVDSTNYLNGAKYARHKNERLDSDYVRGNYDKIRLLHFIQEHKLGEYYYDKWKHYCKWE